MSEVSALFMVLVQHLLVPGKKNERFFDVGKLVNGEVQFNELF